MTCRSSSEWSGRLKWAATGLSVFWVLMSDLWLFILMWRRFAVLLSSISCTGLGRPDSWFCMWVKTVTHEAFLSHCHVTSLAVGTVTGAVSCLCGCVCSSFSIWPARVGPSGCVGAWMQLWVGEGWLFCICPRHGEHSAVSSKSLLFWRGLGGRWLQVEPIGWIDVLLWVWLQCLHLGNQWILLELFVNSHASHTRDPTTLYCLFTQQPISLVCNLWSFLEYITIILWLIQWNFRRKLG